MLQNVATLIAVLTAKKAFRSMCTVSDVVECLEHMQLLLREWAVR